MKRYLLPLMVLAATASAQTKISPDSLRGSNTHYRSFWDLKKYRILVEPHAEDKTVTGQNEISFVITQNAKNPTFQIDLQQPMGFEILKTSFKTKSVKREGNFIFVESAQNLRKGERGSMTIRFFGNPTIAKNAPWDGGWVFQKDHNGKPFIGVAQEGIGVSVWLPSKDFWGDEPDDGMEMKIITPIDLVGVGNGQLVKETNEPGGKKGWLWQVKNPINGYSLAPSVADYVHFSEEHLGEGGKLKLDYYVLRENEAKARQQFLQVHPMLQHLEWWLGKYPFYEDGYKLVETPYLGMEHQSNVAYGNGYQNGYRGRDLSGTGVGMKWDFIIVHESGHEWFANSITARDEGDMWIHEAFTSYAETLFTEKFLDKNSAEAYVIGKKKLIENDSPLQGPYGVAKSGSGDMYWKGENMIHTLRQMIHDDARFREILREMCRVFYHKLVTGQEVEDFWQNKTGLPLKPFFDQYVRTTKIPAVEFEANGDGTRMRLTNAVAGLRMPYFLPDGRKVILSENWSEFPGKLSQKQLENPNYLLNWSEVKP